MNAAESYLLFGAQTVSGIIVFVYLQFLNDLDYS